MALLGPLGIGISLIRHKARASQCDSGRTSEKGGISLIGLLANVVQYAIYRTHVFRMCAMGASGFVVIVSNKCNITSQADVLRRNAKT